MEKQSIFSLNDLKFVLRIIRKNWWVPLAVLPFFLAFSYIYTYKLIPIYKVQGEILLQNNEEYYKSSVISENVLASTYIDNSNEQRVIQSYDLIKKVVERLKEKLEVSYYIVGKVRTTEQFSGMPFRIEVIAAVPGIMEVPIDFFIVNEKEFLIKYKFNNSPRELRGVFGKQITNQELSIIAHPEFDSFDKSNFNVVSQIFYQFKIHALDAVISGIRASMSVENPEYTNFLVVSVQDILPERGKLVLDSIIKNYVYGRIEQKFELNERTVQYIDKQLDEISSRLKNNFDSLLNFKRNKSILNIDWQQNLYLSRISTLDNEISQINIQQSALRDLENYVMENKDPQFIPPDAYIFKNDAYMTRAVQELYTKQSEINKILLVAKPNNITVLENLNYIKRLKNELLVYIKNTQKVLDEKKQNIYFEFSKYLSEAKEIDPKQRELNDIQRILKINENIYNFLLEKRANTLIARASIVPDVKIIEEPRNFGVVWPDVAAINKKFLIGGIALALIIIIIRALWFTRVESVDHLKELTNLPAIGIIPKTKSKESPNEFYVLHSPNSNVAESFRAIRANLQYAMVHQNMKTILITSYFPAEGKTFVSLNLAGLLAKSGKKVLLMELDLHKPRIFNALGLKTPESGITTYLNNMHELKDIIYQHPQIETLHILFTGIIPPNPSDYIISDKLKNLITEVQNNYEYIIMDTPPAGLLSDSVYLMQFADASVFVLNAEKTNQREIQFINTLVKENNLTNLFLILNAVHFGLKKYYYSGYGYSYGYGYGYGYGKYRKD